MKPTPNYTIEDFQQFVSDKTIVELSDRDVSLMALMGLAGETGELIDAMKKSHFYGKGKNREHLMEEVGDILHYAMMFLNTEGIPVGDVIQANVDKISRRYPGAVPTKRNALERADKQ